MTRREALMASTAVALVPAGSAAAPSGRLKQSVARWCYARIPLDDLCRQAADMGLVGMDLIDAPDWPTARKYGLTPAMVQGKGKIPVGWNHKENHDQLAKDLQDLIVAAADAKVPNVITFSGIHQRAYGIHQQRRCRWERSRCESAITRLPNRPQGSRYRRRWQQGNQVELNIV